MLGWSRTHHAHYVSGHRSLHTHLSVSVTLGGLAICGTCDEISHLHTSAVASYSSSHIPQ